MKRVDDQQPATPPSEPVHGYYVEFKRGWWSHCLGQNKDRKDSQQTSGTYHGSVTEQQAKELEKIVTDYLMKGDQPPRLTAYGMRDFIGRAIAYWKSEPGERAEREAAELLTMIDRKPQSETGRLDLASYVNAASIGAADSPHEVVEKLQKAIDASLPLGGDAKRLDFAEIKAATIYCSSGGHWVFVDERGKRHEDRRGILGTSIRGCIDAAMKEAK